MVIYNEVIDTIRAIMNIFQQKKREAFEDSKQKHLKSKFITQPDIAHKMFDMPMPKGDSDDEIKNPRLKVSEKYDVLEEIQR